MKRKASQMEGAMTIIHKYYKVPKPICERIREACVGSKEYWKKMFDCVVLELNESAQKRSPFLEIRKKITDFFVIPPKKRKIMALKKTLRENGYGAWLVGWPIPGVLCMGLRTFCVRENKHFLPSKKNRTE